MFSPTAVKNSFFCFLYSVKYRLVEDFVRSGFGPNQQGLTCSVSGYLYFRKNCDTSKKKKKKHNVFHKCHSLLLLNLWLKKVRTTVYYIPHKFPIWNLFFFSFSDRFLYCHWVANDQFLSNLSFKHNANDVHIFCLSLII